MENGGLLLGKKMVYPFMDSKRKTVEKMVLFEMTFFVEKDTKLVTVQEDFLMDARERLQKGDKVKAAV